MRRVECWGGGVDDVGNAVLSCENTEVAAAFDLLASPNFKCSLKDQLYCL